jgi:hypothetical protein
VLIGTLAPFMIHKKMQTMKIIREAPQHIGDVSIYSGQPCSLSKANTPLGSSSESPSLENFRSGTLLFGVLLFQTFRNLEAINKWLV